MPVKGHRYLLEAIPLTLEFEPKTVFPLVGDGRLMQPLRTAAYDNMGLRPDSVVFLGRQPDLREYLWASDVSVLPSLWEGPPLALIEAQAAGAPQVVTNVWGNRDVVTHDETGLLAEPADAWALAEGIIRMLRDGEFRAYCSERSMARAEALFSTGTMVEVTARVYREVLELTGL